MLKSREHYLVLVVDGKTLPNSSYNQVDTNTQSAAIFLLQELKLLNQVIKLP